jgi:hypothetical protein
MFSAIIRVAHTHTAPKFTVLRNTILIIKANVMHCFSNLFDKVLYMFRTGPLASIRSISTLYDIYLLRVYIVEILLMMASGPVRNM